MTMQWEGFNAEAITVLSIDQNISTYFFKKKKLGNKNCIILSLITQKHMSMCQ